MATTLTHKAYETILSLLTTELNSLANGSFSSASAAQGADATGGPLYGDFELNEATRDPTLYTTAELYILRSADGTNYEDAPSSTNPGSGMLVGVFIGSDASAARRNIIPDVPLPPGLWKAVLKNVGGAAMNASGSTLKCRPHNLLST